MRSATMAEISAVCTPRATRILLYPRFNLIGFFLTTVGELWKVRAIWTAPGSDWVNRLVERLWSWARNRRRFCCSKGRDEEDNDLWCRAVTPPVDAVRARRLPPV